MSKSKLLLTKNNIRITDIRVDILDCFFSKNHALSHQDIEKEISKLYDRVTIYRTLNLYIEKGLLHKIPDEKSGLKYALCLDHCSADDHHHDHIHFKCTQCEEIHCIEDPSLILQYKLPDGYLAKDKMITITGFCKNCYNLDLQ